MRLINLYWRINAALRLMGNARMTYRALYAIKVYARSRLSERAPNGDDYEAVIEIALGILDEVDQSPVPRSWADLMSWQESPHTVATEGRTRE